MLQHNITLTGFTQPEAASIKGGLVADNPTWLSSHNMGKSVFGIPPKLIFYEQPDPQTLIVPVGYLDTLQKLFKNIHVIDNRFENTKKINVVFTGALRPYQQQAVDALSKVTNGILCSATGSGKTTILCALIAKIKQPVLILVDTFELANQFTERIKTFLNVKDVGLIGSGKKNIKEITVGLLQSVTKMDPVVLNKMFGMVIVDEVLDKVHFFAYNNL